MSSENESRYNVAEFSLSLSIFCTLTGSAMHCSIVFN